MFTVAPPPAHRRSSAPLHPRSNGIPSRNQVASAPPAIAKSKTSGSGPATHPPGILPIPAALRCSVSSRNPPPSSSSSLKSSQFLSRPSGRIARARAQRQRLDQSVLNPEDPISDDTMRLAPIPIPIPVPIPNLASLSSPSARKPRSNGGSGPGRKARNRINNNQGNRHAHNNGRGNHGKPKGPKAHLPDYFDLEMMMDEVNDIFSPTPPSSESESDFIPLSFSTPALTPPTHTPSPVSCSPTFPFLSQAVYTTPPHSPAYALPPPQLSHSVPPSHTRTPSSPPLFTPPPPAPSSHAHIRSPSLGIFPHVRYANSAFQHSPEAKELPKPRFLLGAQDTKMDLL